MTKPTRPVGYPAVSPYLVVPGAQAVIDFAVKTFGAVALRRFDMPDGTVMHAEFLIDDSVVMVGDAGGQWPAIPTFLHVYVADVDQRTDARSTPAACRCKRRSRNPATSTSAAA